MAARGTASGSVEFAIQARAAGGPWGELLFGSSRFMTPRLIAQRQWRYASPVVARPLTAGPSTPPAPSRPPSTDLPCENCRADPADFWINFTQGHGVASRDDCRLSARTGRRGLPQGTAVERVASGTGRCEGWSYVTAGDKATWVRNIYLADVPIPYDARWHPPLPIPFCSLPLDPELGAGFSADDFLEGVRDAVGIWNDALQEADHELALSGPALDYIGECEDGERRSGRNEILVTPLPSAGVTIRRASESCIVNGGQRECERAYEADVLISPMRCGLEPTITHELGHALGLLHGGQLGDLMYHAFTGCPTSRTPNAVEVAAILEGRAEGE